MNIDALPAGFRETGLFCCWKYEERNGRRTKVPYNPRTGGKAQSTNPGTFAPLPVALDAAAQGGYSGIGVGVFGSLGAVDIDHCISENGELSELAFDVMSIMNSYTEYSPSGKGLRILFTVPGEFQYNKTRYYINNQKAGLEIYIAGCTQKYVTVTGDTLTPGCDLEDREEQLMAVLEKYMVRPKAQKPTPPPPKQKTESGGGGLPDPDGGALIGGGGLPDLDDRALIERAKRSKNGALFASL